MVELQAIKLLQRDGFESYKGKMQKLLSPKSYSKIMNKSVIACQPSLLGEIIVRNEMAGKLDISPEKIDFKHTVYGKPYCEEYPGFHFNISHSKEWVVVAFSDKDVGVDIEKIKPVNMNIAKRFFSKQEYADLIQKNENEQITYFFDLWTAKESFVKNTGTGIANIFDTFSIRIEGNNIRITERDFPPVKFKSYLLPDQYKVCVCAFEPDFSETPRILEIENLLI